jgi:putative endonuclease
MKYFVYIIRSVKSGRFYIGSTANLNDRLAYHNGNKVIATRNKGPWKIMYTEIFRSRSEAVRREKQIKSYKGGEAFKLLIRRGMA